MYIVYVAHYCKLGAYGFNENELALLTNNKSEAIAKAHELAEWYSSDPDAYIDSEWDGTFNSNSVEGRSDAECIVFYNEQENWDWYSEIHVVELQENIDYLPTNNRKEYSI